MQTEAAVTATRKLDDRGLTDRVSNRDPNLNLNQ